MINPASTSEENTVIEGSPVTVWRPRRARRLAHQAALFARASAGARRRRAPGYSKEAEERAGRDLLARLNSLPRELAAECRLVRVPADRAPWLDSGIEVRAGEQVSTFSCGRAWLSHALDVWMGPRFQLWARIGTRGPVFRGARDTNTFTAADTCRLYLASYFPGTWADSDGRLASSPRDYRRASGEIATIVVRWAVGVDPEAILAAHLTSADRTDLARDELDRLRTPKPAPTGWNYTWILGEADIWTNTSDGRGVIDCHCEQNVGVVQYEVDVPLTAATRLRWRWLIDRLPSPLAEDSVLTHDYTSIAIEFENGQDITYHWSAELPEGYTYRCPLPYWNHLETHVALRTGTDQLGRWVAEDRPVQEDYRGAIGDPPARIVRVWLIALSVFQHGTGSTRFADIELVNDGETLRL
ncbi:MAG: DUF3047 domain-containing protein [Mycobacterium sp.]|nr:DUF3047 domain-containing protein [Mycobacterium sp.]